MKQPTEVAIIGAGRLGTALGLALSKRDYVVHTMVSRTPRSAKRAARLLRRSTTPLSLAQVGLLRIPDLLFVTTPDDQIEVVAEALETLEVPKGKKPVALHTSGALSSTVLSGLSTRGWQVGSLHPLLSISGLRGEVDFEGAYWCIEGQPLAQRQAKEVVRSLNGKSFSIAVGYKALYHAAAVMASGNVVALFDAAIEMLTASGLRKREAKEVLIPLLESAVRNLGNRETSTSLTGPFARGDLETIKLHLQALAKTNNADIAALYRILGRRSLKLAKGTSLDKKTIRRIKNLLD